MGAWIGVSLGEAATDSNVCQVWNEGEVRGENVEVVVPEGAEGWRPQFDAVESYPIAVLEPGETVPIPVALAPGAPTTIEVTVRATAAGGPYERQTIVSAATEPAPEPE